MQEFAHKEEQTEIQLTVKKEEDHKMMIGGWQKAKVISNDSTFYIHNRKQLYFPASSGGGACQYQNGERCVSLTMDDTSSGNILVY